MGLQPEVGSAEPNPRNRKDHSESKGELRVLMETVSAPSPSPKSPNPPLPPIGPGAPSEVRMTVCEMPSRRKGRWGLAVATMS
mgnify:CR=1 FL=1